MTSPAVYRRRLYSKVVTPLALTLKERKCSYPQLSVPGLKEIDLILVSLVDCCREIVGFPVETDYIIRREIAQPFCPREVHRGKIGGAVFRQQ